MPKFPTEQVAMTPTIPPVKQPLRETGGHCGIRNYFYHVCLMIYHLSFIARWVTNTVRAEKMRSVREFPRQTQYPKCYLTSGFSQRLCYFRLSNALFIITQS